MTLPDHIRVLERGWLSNNIVFLDPTAPRWSTPGMAPTPSRPSPSSTRPCRASRCGAFSTPICIRPRRGNALLQAHHDCETWIPPGLQEAVTQWDESCLSYAATGQACARFRHDRVMQPGQTIDIAGDDWLVLSAAGHDNDMLMLWCERSGILISADALWENGFGVIFPGIDGRVRLCRTASHARHHCPVVASPGHSGPRRALHRCEGRLGERPFTHSLVGRQPRRNTDNAIKALLAFRCWQHAR